jgi:hypothetical protein
MVKFTFMENNDHMILGSYFPFRMNLLKVSYQ